MAETATLRKCHFSVGVLTRPVRYSAARCLSQPGCAGPPLPSLTESCAHPDTAGPGGRPAGRAGLEPAARFVPGAAFDRHCALRRSSRAQRAADAGTGPVHSLRTQSLLAAALNEAAATEGELQQAGLLPNPSIDVSMDDRRKASRTTTTTLSMPIETGGKRGARVKAAGLARDIAQTDLGAARADLRSTVIAAFFDVATAQETVRVAQENASIAQKALQLADKRVAAGKGAAAGKQRGARGAGQCPHRRARGRSRAAGRPARPGRAVGRSDACVRQRARRHRPVAGARHAG